MGIGLIIYAVVMLALSYALMPKPEEPDAAKKSDFQMPTAAEGRAVQVVFGKRRMTGPNVVDWEYKGAVAMKERVGNWFKNSLVTVGFRYYFDMHLIVGYTCDGIKQIWVDHTCIWPTVGDPSVEASDGTTSGTVQADTAFGGDKGGGGVDGDFFIQYGGASQTAHSYLTAWRGSDVPAYRGLTGVGLENMYLSNSTVLHPLAFVVKRTDTLTAGDAQWYSAKANIGDDDLNPAHILRECLTDQEWGMAHDASLIDSTTFEAVADTLYTEGFGLSLIWDSGSTTIEDFVKDVLRHIDGTLALNPQTGKWELSLARDDYTVGSLETFDESDIIEVTRLERGAPGEVTNQVVVGFHDRDANARATVTDQDIAMIAVQGGDVIESVYEFDGICDKDIAAQVAARERKQATSMLAPVQIVGKRTMAHLKPNDVFILAYDPLGITQLIVRVAAVDYGNLHHGQVTLDVVEDVFGVADALYASRPDTQWTNSINDPSETTTRAFVEIPYYTLVQSLGQTAADALSATAAYFGVVASPPTDDAWDFELQVQHESGGDFYSYGQRNFCATATLTSALPIGASAATVDLSNVESMVAVIPNTWAVLGDEVVLVTAVDTANDQVTISRGALDTVPAAHASGTRIWFADAIEPGVDHEYDSSDSPSVKLLTRTQLGSLAAATASSYSVTAFNNRQIRPYPPGDVKIDSASYPSSFTGQPTVSWGHKDRTALTGDVPIFTDTTGSAESSATYSLKIYDEDNNLVRTETGLTGTSYTYLEADERSDCGLGPTDDLNGSLRFELWTVRGSYTSWQTYDYTVARV